ncbi:hypothetical protein MDA_GLEAN10008170 [Myotis davidii]|uniref:Uncharacterized protein n=1 Tax=Myotis davidii TaxID=225400 RepID=L5LKX9_MYODS|nr:hypothetical protein MDA_GLEAN10008170 [Myotis davidii]
MSVLLVLGLLAAGLCPTVHGLPGDTPDQKVAPGNETPVDNLRLTSSRLCLQPLQAVGSEEPQ